MLSEQQIRLQLNDLHICITDVLESIDEHAYTAADLTLNRMQSNIKCLRQEVTELFDTRGIASACRRSRGTNVLCHHATSLN